MTTVRPEELSLLFYGINNFSFHVIEKLHKLEENNLISPLFVHEFITLISQDPWFYKKEIFNRILTVDVDQSNSQYKDVLTILGLVTDLVIENVAFVKEHGIIRGAFKDRLKDNYGGDINSVNFSSPESAAEAINAWFSGKRAQKIAQFNNIKDNINLSLLSSLSLKSAWPVPFPAEDSAPGTFHLNGEDTIEVPMMTRTGDFYYENISFLGAKILKLPLADDNVSLVVLLPNVNSDAPDIMTSLRDFVYQNLHYHMETLTKQEVKVTLPKFKLTEALELSSYLKKMELENIFDANIFDIIDGAELTCNEIQQRLFLEVNEAGVEAVSGTISTLIEARDEKEPPKDGLIVYEAKMSTEISNRFAKTKVVWRVKNSNTQAADANFKVILTETAFISEFVMEIEGKSYKSYIKEKEEAKNIYNEAVAHGQSAGLVQATTRDSKEFTVSVNLEPDSVAVFSLTYEEMLQRIHDQYELVLNICPGQIVDDLSIEVYINESRPLKYVKTPPLRSGKDMNVLHNDRLDPTSDIKIINSKTASVKFRPDIARQKKMTHYLGNSTNQGLFGQFVVQYDVEREPLNGEVLLQDGYFVHFFAPNDLEPLPKHIVFVLDTSGSMDGRKIQQLKDAMMNILNDLRKEDMLSIVEFNYDVIVWDVNLKKSVSISENQIKDFREPFAYLKKCIMANPQYVSDEIRSKAKEVVQGLEADGSTFIIGGLETGLYLIKTGQQNNENKEERLQPIIVFLTDGQPNVGIHSTDEIVEVVTQLNRKDKVPIFSLSLGDYADKDFLRKLSLRNVGFSRHIYEAADTSLQLQDFYKQISCPLLHDINFKYDAQVEQVTRTWFPIYFRGSELVVAGRCGDGDFPSQIGCRGPRGPIIIRSHTERPVTSLERLWAYLTVKQLLDERETSENPAELTQKAIQLALKYSFVTDVTSLVVVKPNEATTAGQILPSVEDREEISRICRGAHRSIGFSMPVQCATGSLSNARGQLKFRKAKKMSFNHPTNHRAQPVSFVGYQGGSGIEVDYMCNIEQLLDAHDEVEEIKHADKEENKPEKVKQPEEFIANRPFLVVLVYKKENQFVILSQGQVCRPEH